MITEWFIWLGTTIAGWFASLFPSWTPPDFFVTFDDKVTGLFTAGAGLGAWFDQVVLLSCVAAVLGVYLITGGVKLVLKIAGFIPFFGGTG